MTSTYDLDPADIDWAKTARELRAEVEHKAIVTRALFDENAMFWDRIRAVLSECDKLRFSPVAKEPTVQRFLDTVYETLAPKDEYVPVYSICGHDHADGEPGVISIGEGYLTCEKEGFRGYQRPDLAEE